MNVLPFPLQNIAFLFNPTPAQHKGMGSSPISRLASPYFPSLSPSFFPGMRLHHMWRVLNFFCALGSQLLSLILRVLGCFQATYPAETISSPIQTPQFNKNDLQKLFSQPINYEQFHDAALSWKRGRQLFLNNYDLKSFQQLKESHLELLNDCKTKKEREFKASVAVYDAIVDCYVKHFLDQHPELDSEEYLPALRTVALGLAIKVSWDEAVWNADFLPLLSPYFGRSTYNKMELEFLIGINWNIWPREIYSTDNPLEPVFI
jgi:hypothetical protein